nr:FixH family protein [uncultured Rhodoferax sp.]
MNVSLKNAADLPWWRHRFVWLVIAGPAIVVVASFITLYLAISRPNEIISDESYKPQRQSDQSIEARRKESGEAPAMQGRNHAATGIVPPTK